MARRGGRVAALTLVEGQSAVIVGIGDYGWASSDHYVVTTDGVTWTATLGQIPHEPSGKRFSSWVRKQLRIMPPELRLPLLWAKKALKGKPSGTSLSTAAAETNPAEVFAFGTAPTDRVTMFGFKRRKLAHSLPTIVGMFTDSVNRCQAAWGWRPVNAEVEIHTTSKAMGLAFNPGQLRHRISLNLRLLTEFDLASVQRVVLHELCHHYREERFTRSYDPHDDVFCRELQKVDTKLADDAARIGQAVGEMCTRFYEQRDIAAELVVRKKRRPSAVEPVWAPDAGTVQVAHLKNGQYRFAWKPIDGLVGPNGVTMTGFNWTPKVERLTDQAILDLVKRFAPTQLDRISVYPRRRPDGSPMWPGRVDPPPNLLGFVQWLLRGFPRLTPNLASYMRDVITVHTQRASA